jgi:ribosomal-protein-alanine N-acetyltransferase
MSSSTAPVLTTPRLNLRPLTTPDAEHFTRILRDPHVARMLPRRVRLEGGRAFVDRISQEQRSGAGFAFAIVPKALGYPIGQVRLIDWDQENRNAELGIWIGRHWWEEGFGPEAIRAVGASGFGKMRLHRIEALVLSENRRAARALEKCGFQLEGRRREVVRFNRGWRDVMVLAALRVRTRKPAPGTGTTRPRAAPTRPRRKGAG